MGDALLDRTKSAFDVIFNRKVCEPRHEETNNVIMEEVWHKSSCTSTEDG